MDGWYIDLDTSISCEQKSLSGKRAHAFLAVGNAAIERMEFVYKGEPESGFPIERKITMKETVTLFDGTKGERTFVNQMRVTQLVEGPLDPALFVIPTGFRQTEHIDRNPPANLPNQWIVAWDRLKASVARLFR